MRRFTIIHQQRGGYHAEFIHCRLHPVSGAGTTVGFVVVLDWAIPVRQGEFPTGLYLIRSGEAMLMLADENRNITHFNVGAGTILGLPAIVAKEPYSLSATACEHSEVGFVELWAFEELMREQPSLFPKVLAVLAAEVRSARQALTRILRDLEAAHPAPFDCNVG